MAPTGAQRQAQSAINETVFAESDMAKFRQWVKCAFGQNSFIRWATPDITPDMVLAHRILGREDLQSPAGTEVAHPQAFGNDLCWLAMSTETVHSQEIFMYKLLSTHLKHTVSCSVPDVSLVSSANTWYRILCRRSWIVELIKQNAQNSLPNEITQFVNNVVT